VKTVEKIIKETTGKTQSFNTITTINSEAGQITDTKETANVFHNFFIQITENPSKHINVYKALHLLKKLILIKLQR
jgi:hypothetical protein